MLNDHDFQQRLRAKAPKSPPQHYNREQTEQYKLQIKKQLKDKKAMLIAHYYTDAEIQKLAEETGGFIGDSLEMAKVGAASDAEVLVIAGVKFMGDTAKILSPQKNILMPDLEAECSLDIGCEPSEFEQFCKQHKDRTVVVYANTSARVKALADWTVTSSIALDVVQHLKTQGKKLVWAPDKYLGGYIKAKTNADMILWNAYCTVHAEFDAEKIKQLKEKNPDAEILVHPESKAEVIELADVVGSTSQLLKASIEHKTQKFIVATETGILYKMQQASPDKEFIFAPTSAASTIKCDADCPWMKMNSLENIAKALDEMHNCVKLEQQIIDKALVPLERMINFKR
jgi:quinolinate synthase